MSKRKLKSAYRKFVGRMVDWFELAEYDELALDEARSRG